MQILVAAVGDKTLHKFITIANMVAAPVFISFDGFYSGAWFLFVLVVGLARSYGKNIIFKKLQLPTIIGKCIFPKLLNTNL